MEEGEASVHARSEVSLRVSLPLPAPRGGMTLEQNAKPSTFKPAKMPFILQ